MGDIKSAREIAMEKVEELGEATEEERLGWKYRPEGEELAAKYMNKEYNINVEIGKYEEKARRYVLEGAAGILVRNIDLPADDVAKQTNRRAMDGLKALVNDKVAVENVYSKIRQLFNHYAEQGEQQRRQAYQQVKADFEAKVQQAMQQQLGTAAVFKMDVEKQPQFQEEWRRVRAQLDSQYRVLLGDYKKELLSLGY